MTRESRIQTWWIVEGPAGSGKTTFIQKLQEASKAKVIDLPWLPRPRTYEGPLGEALAVTKDFARVAVGLTYPGNIILDRFTVSRVIYNAYRRSITPSTEDKDNGRLEHLLSTTYYNSISMIAGVRYSLENAAVDVPINMDYRWVFLLPNIMTIDERRKKAGREFPFDLEYEYTLYTWVTNKIKEMTWIGKTYILTEDEPDVLSVL